MMPSTDVMQDLATAIQGKNDGFVTNGSLNSYVFSLFNFQFKMDFSLGLPLKFKKDMKVETGDNTYYFKKYNSIWSDEWTVDDEHSTLKVSNFSLSGGFSLPITSYFRFIYFYGYRWEDIEFSHVYSQKDGEFINIVYDNDHWYQQFHLEILPFQGNHHSGFYVSYTSPFAASTETWGKIAFGFSTHFVLRD